MLLITSQGRSFNVKYQQNKEKVTFTLHGDAREYPYWEGTKVQKNASSSNEYAMTFAIHSTLEEIESLKWVNVDNASVDVEVNGANYNGITNIVLIHEKWGELRGEFLGKIQVDNSSEADVLFTGIFKINTPDETPAKKDIEQENEDAAEEIDSETDEEFELEEDDRPALLKIAEGLEALYDNIQNSAVVAAFNDLKSALNEAILNYQKVMNAFKKVVSLAASVADAIGDIRNKLDMFKKQFNAIKNIIPNSLNRARFNMNLLSFNNSRAARLIFSFKASRRQRSGLKVAPIK